MRAAHTQQYILESEASLRRSLSVLAHSFRRGAVCVGLLLSGTCVLFGCGSQAAAPPPPTATPLPTATVEVGFSVNVTAIPIRSRAHPRPRPSPTTFVPPAAPYVT